MAIKYWLTIDQVKRRFQLTEEQIWQLIRSQAVESRSESSGVYVSVDRTNRRFLDGIEKIKAPSFGAQDPISDGVDLRASVPAEDESDVRRGDKTEIRPGSIRTDRHVEVKFASTPVAEDESPMITGKPARLLTKVIDQEGLDIIRKSLELTEKSFSTVLSVHQQLIVEKDERIKSLQQQVSDKDAYIALLEEQVSRSDVKSLIQERNANSDAAVV